MTQNAYLAHLGLSYSTFGIVNATVSKFASDSITALPADKPIVPGGNLEL